MKISSQHSPHLFPSAFDRTPTSPSEPVATVRKLLQGPILNQISKAASKLGENGVVAVHGYEDLSSGHCSVTCHRKVGRAFLLVRDGARSANLNFSGCANVPGESWMIESHASFDRLPPPCVSRCSNVESLETFASNQITCFLLALSAARELNHFDDFTDFFESPL